MISFDIVQNLSDLIAIQSFSKEEENAADLIEKILKENDIAFSRDKNNVFAKNKHFVEGRYTILLNSHIDTVKPNTGYSLPPFDPIQKDGKLYGLGSNDAGGALMGLLGAFINFYDKENLPYNLIFAATAEEEISGKNGMEYLFPKLPAINFAIVGEPTLMQIAVAERGLLVLDATALGKSGHAARKEGVNALYKAIEDIQWFRNFQFEKNSAELGPVSMTVTMIESGTQHNVVPDQCKFVVDIRVNDQYSNIEILEIIRQNVQSEVTARSTRLNSSGVSEEHAIRKVATALNIPTYGSPTTSDQALIPCESIKMGPGDSARSHTADEYIHLYELQTCVSQYITVLYELGKVL